MTSPSPASRGRRTTSRGFTLLEMVVVIGIIAVLAGAFVPLMLRPFTAQRQNETVRELTALETAILGRPENGDFGFVGTMGRLPPAGTTGLQELLVQGVMPAPAFGELGMPKGWAGPYLRVGTALPLLDGWGQPYVLERDILDNTLWRLRSTGPNRVAEDPGDDIILPSPSEWFRSAGSLTLNLQSVRNTVSVPLADTYVAAVQLHQPVNEINGSDLVSTCTPSGGVCTFASVPFGVRTVVVTLNATAPGGAQTIKRHVTVTGGANVATISVPIPDDPNSLGADLCDSGVASTTTAANGRLQLCAASKTFTLPADTVLTANAVATVRRTNGTGRCLVGIAIDGDIALGLAAATQDYNVVGSESDDFVPVSTTRSHGALAAGTHTLNYYVEGTGGAACRVEGGSLHFSWVKK